MNLLKKTIFALSVAALTATHFAFADSERVVNTASGHSYQRVDLPYDWYSAQAYCESQGGYLATVADQAENDFIYSVAGGYDVWLGGTDEAQEGVWRWVTGEPWSYSNWYAGEPNNFSEEDHLHLPAAWSGQWNDGQAGYGVFFVCEWGSSEWTTAYADLLSSETDLATLRQFRDEVLMASASGKIYTNMLYENSEDALRILQGDPELMHEARVLIDANLDVVKAVLAGESATLTDTAAVMAFLRNFAQHATGSLRLLATTVLQDMQSNQASGEPFFGVTLQ